VIKRDAFKKEIIDIWDAKKDSKDVTSSNHVPKLNPCIH
jgi:hypothetical protein